MNGISTRATSLTIPTRKEDHEGRGDTLEEEFDEFYQNQAEVETDFGCRCITPLSIHDFRRDQIFRTPAPEDDGASLTHDDGRAKIAALA